MKAPFRHKNIRLPLDHYVGMGWFFVTFCCEGRKRIFLDSSRAQWFLDNLRNHALSDSLAIHAFCVMPDHVHLLTEGLAANSDLLRFLRDLKQKTGFTYKRETSEQLWQKKSYDHALRSSDRPQINTTARNLAPTLAYPRRPHLKMAQLPHSGRSYVAAGFSLALLVLDFLWGAAGSGGIGAFPVT